MTIQQIYDLAIEMGIDSDPRGKAKIKKLLEKRKKAFADLPAKKTKLFDPETLRNPYSDTRILYGDPKLQVKKVMAGIDADASEVIVADRLREKGNQIDLVISHHPSGHALASLHDVMDVHTEMLAEDGVPINIAHALLSDRANLVKRRISPANHGQAVDAARLLDVPLMSIHTVWDNLGNQFMNEYVRKKEKDFDEVGELLDYILEIPEFIEQEKWVRRESNPHGVAPISF